MRERGRARMRDSHCHGFISTKKAKRVSPLPLLMTCDVQVIPGTSSLWSVLHSAISILLPGAVASQEGTKLSM